jgi:hypothetical protein
MMARPTITITGETLDRAGAERSLKFRARPLIIRVQAACLMAQRSS